MMTEFCEEDLLINDNELKADDVFAVMGAVENLETNKRSCDSGEITNDHIGGYLHHHISGNDINQQQLSVHNPQLNQQHDLNDEEFHDSPASSQSAPVKRHKREFVWLEVIGEPCHSEKQESSGSDLTHVKKKYKKMHCLYCSQYNPRTPWATVKSRKFEIDGFAEHERSAHHLKALAVKDGTNPLLMNSDLRHGNQMMGSGRGLMAQNYGAAVALMRSNQQSQQQQQMTQLQQNANQAQHNQLSQYHLDNVQLQQQHQQQQQHLRQQQHQQQQQQQAMQLHQMQLTAQQQGRVMANNGNTAQVLSAAVSQDDDSDDSSDEDDLAVLSRGSSATMSAAGLPVNLIPVNVNNGGNELTPQQIMLLHAQQQQQIYQQQQQQHIHHQQQSLHQQNHNHQQQHMQQLNHQSQLQLPANMLQQPQQNNNGNGAAAVNANSNLHQQQQQQVATSELFPVNALSLAESKTKCMPEWLRVEGKLCFSDKQGDGASMLSSAKKKYKLVMCVYCREFNPSSPWAMLKARKFETSVILEHERSHNHKKAVNMREAAICARQLQQLHAPDYVPAEYAPADYLQHQMDALESGGAQQQHLSVAGLSSLAGMSQISESQALQQLQQQQAQAAQAQQVLAQQQMRQAAELQLHQQQQQQQQQAQQVQLQTQQQSQHQQTQQTQQQQAQAQAQHYHQLAQQLHHQQHLQQQLLQQQHQQQYGSQHHCHNQLQQLQQQQQQQLLRQHQQILQLQQLQHQQQGPLGGVMHGQQQGHLVIVQPQHGPQLHLMDGGDEDLEDELDEAESDAALLAAHFQSQDQDSESQDYETQGSETQEEDQDDDDLCLDIDSLTPRTPLARHR